MIAQYEFLWVITPNVKMSRRNDIGFKSKMRDYIQVPRRRSMKTGELTGKVQEFMRERVMRSQNGGVIFGFLGWVGL